MNKKILLFGILGLFAVALVSAGLIIYHSQTQVTINVEQPISVVGDEAYTIESVMAGQEPFLREAITISNIADFPVNVLVTDNAIEGILVNYVGVLELTKKDTTTWQPTEDKIEVVYTIVGDTFEFSGVPEGYTLIYYKDFVVGLENRTANPRPAITVTSDIGSLPKLDDVNAELENYCQDPDNYAHCNGAKLWVVPTSDINNGDLNWANMADYYYETDLVYYFANANGEIIVPANSFIEFYPEYTLASNLETGDYTITTFVEPIVVA